MDIQRELFDSVSPSSVYRTTNCLTEDSGYHTSFTPGSTECSEVSIDSVHLSRSVGAATISLDSICEDSRSSTLKLNLKCRRLKSNSISSINDENSASSSPVRRGRKRTFQEGVLTELSFKAASTPTSFISGGIQKLNVNERDTSVLRSLNETENIVHTPIECTKPFSKRLKFHYQKIDIIEMMYSKERCCMDVIKKIFSYLSNEDIYNFSMVSPLWLRVCNDVPGANSQIEQYAQFIENTKENFENRSSGKVSEVPHVADEKSLNFLKDIYNTVEARHHQETPKSSPPGTPRTIRFKRFAKSGSLDSRIQLCCVRCGQPAKVNEEQSGEEWVECSSLSCAFQFCRHCKCDRHPGKKCFQYDLEAPSPSKRKKSVCAIGTKKSRRNLRRLL